MQYRRRRIIVAIVSLLVVGFGFWRSGEFDTVVTTYTPAVVGTTTVSNNSQNANTLLDTLAVKGRAPKTDYARTQFGDGWQTLNGCDTRNDILHRDLKNVVTDDSCKVISGELNDPYTGKVINFERGSSTSGAVQIDHVVALSNAWQTGAQQLTPAVRIELANDPLELLAVDGPANQAKSDGDAATWLPSNKAFRCQYVARQIAVKAKYKLWVTAPEKSAIQNVLAKCPDQLVPAGSI
ncbi:MAG: HNH endonuclease family protein [Candidatus Saccharimonas sp.]